jgi:beta-lactamase class A
MRNRRSFFPLQWVGIVFIFLAVILTVVQLTIYSRIRSSFPPGMMVAGIPVGGMDTQHAAERLLQAYTAVPVEVRYRDSVIQIKPSVVGFTLDLESMMSAADQERLSQPFWIGFWEFLWNRLPQPKPVPLISTFSEDRLRVYLKGEIATRYDQPPTSSMPVPGSVNFQTGQAGTILDVDRAVVLIGDAFRSPGSRQVNLTFNRVSPPRPSIENLKILLEQTIQLEGYQGTLELYMNDLQTGQEVHFAYDQGQLISPDIAFTAASTMKIPIMISVFRRQPDPLPQDISDMLTSMIEYSDNGMSDKLMETLDRNTGPLQVTKDIQAMGLKNTFMAGYFYDGAPLLQHFETPANQRKDLTTAPDVYNQTTPTDMGMLLEDIYFCAEKGGGTFDAVFPGQMTQSKCKQMVAFLSKNKNGVLLEAGVPEGIQIAHKHGWTIESDNLMHTVSDAGIVYSPGGNYILTVYLHSRDQVIWDNANEMVGRISQAVYNYFNLPAQ